MVEEDTRAEMHDVSISEASSRASGYRDQYICRSDAFWGFCGMLATDAVEKGRTSMCFSSRTDGLAYI